MPPGAPGAWCIVRVSASGANWWAQIQLSDRARGHVVRQMFLGPLRRGARRTLLHVPAEAEACSLLFIGEDGAFNDVNIRVVSRMSAALRLLWHGWSRLGVAVRGDRLGVVGRIRTVLGQAPGRKGQSPPYAVWLALYEDSGCPNGPMPDIQVAVVGSGSNSAQIVPGSIAVASPADWQKLDAGAVLLLGVGEHLAPYAVSCFAKALLQSPHAGFICADVDSLEACGQRHSPLFKPQPGPLFVESGLATTGACLFRHDGSWAGLPIDADAARLQLAQRCDPSSMVRIPAILTHLSTVPLAKASRTVKPALARFPKVSIVIPTSFRSSHALRCLRTLLKMTSYKNVEFILAVSKIDPPDRTQGRLMDEAARLPAVRVLDLGLPEFNFSSVNNAAIAQLDTEFVLLMNDDVVPRHDDWLDNMMVHALTPGVGAVGARLLYGNDTVQHAGVIMGLAGLCEHADRLMDAANPGDHGRAFIDREVSAVTAACMLVPRALFTDLAGFDAAFAIALNDVDFCLRVGAIGKRIIYAADAILYHYESLSLGRHYRGVRATLEAQEVRRLRERWSNVIADDPCYNPQASLELGREWQPAYPPRVPFSEHSNFGKSATNC